MRGAEGLSPGLVACGYPARRRCVAGVTLLGGRTAQCYPPVTFGSFGDCVAPCLAVDAARYRTLVVASAAAGRRSHSVLANPQALHLLPEGLAADAQGRCSLAHAVLVALQAVFDVAPFAFAQVFAQGLVACGSAAGAAPGLNRASGRITGPSLKMQARSRVCRRSRTLPGQGCSSRARSASGCNCLGGWP